MLYSEQRRYSISNSFVQKYFCGLHYGKIAFAKQFDIYSHLIHKLLHGFPTIFAFAPMQIANNML